MAKRPPSTSSVVPQWEIRRMRVADLVPADYNPRKITARAADGLRASLARFGELGGIVWNERTRRLVGGHQRVKALSALGVEEVDVRVVDLPVAEEKALNVTLNNPAISGEFDFEVLDVVLDDIRADLPNAFEELHLDDIRPVFAPSTGGDSSAGAGQGGVARHQSSGDIDYSEGNMPDLPDAPPEAAKVSFALTPEQRAMLDAALDAAGSDGSTAGRASALVEVCRAYCP